MIIYLFFHASFSGSPSAPSDRGSSPELRHGRVNQGDHLKRLKKSPRPQLEKKKMAVLSSSASSHQSCRKIRRRAESHEPKRTQNEHQTTSQDHLSDSPSAGVSIEPNSIKTPPSVSTNHNNVVSGSRSTEETQYHCIPE